MSNIGNGARAAIYEQLEQLKVEVDELLKQYEKKNPQEPPTPVSPTSPTRFPQSNEMMDSLLLDAQAKAKDAIKVISERKNCMEPDEQLLYLWNIEMGFRERLEKIYSLAKLWDSARVEGKEAVVLGDKVKAALKDMVAILRAIVDALPENETSRMTLEDQCMGEETDDPELTLEDQYMGEETDDPELTWEKEEQNHRNSRNEAIFDQWLKESEDGDARLPTQI